MAREIPLTQGMVAIVDDEDFDLLLQWKWHALKLVRPSGRVDWYAVRGKWRNGKRHQVMMHRLIMEVPVGLEVDHCDGDGLNNRRENLRICTHKQNMGNRGPVAGCSSRFRGVSWSKWHARWQARIRSDGKLRVIGYFDSEEDAAHAFNLAATEEWGDFAQLNDVAPRPLVYTLRKRGPTAGTRYRPRNERAGQSLSPVFAVRCRLGLTQAEFSERSGLSRATLCRAELGYQPTLWPSVLKALADEGMASEEAVALYAAFRHAQASEVAGKC